MASNNDSIKKTLFVVIALSLVCSIIVSTAAVVLKPKQQANAVLDQQTKILEVAGVDLEGDIPALYAENIEPRLVDFATGDFVDGDASAYDQRKAAKDPAQSIKLSAEDDIAKILRRANTGTVYLVKDGAETTKVIIPVHGNGLWSMMYAFVAVETDGNTVSGITYYEQGETPGLGGEVENPTWRAQFVGKKLFDENHKPAIKVVKGGAPEGTEHGVDGLSGATLTSVGVQHTFDFWLGDMGFGPFLAKVRDGGLN
ncbi:Na(+)-translocating NADH-quinone reductase subunit C [Vibrio sp. IB15]|jgi:Na+-transporting NADH:ubiquinone oxidoreductase subunit C|uniref:Na(+)-translocating NADH-quinone reductase subunit C n=1 Tax=Vibrio chagasii TaxID=170679 RepID=A0A7V7NUV9_9VIBR|nr:MULTISPECIES: Na(+)-translocating NADH-quinone reductase subunit C [Vibrio]KAB0480434.1 Na(+)-translocating NADH-quinone reductase subunit C [Vibrio chagasii]MBJ2146254.1 Na(+)-translocating NADH-quinone reductase subunit C [Vibrio sp. IB15]MCG9691232.1 Na(+)-translocating NADH-quinone reductase subunit C [Vibrio sp. Isolate22]NOH33712.1 Na(+)-translocating NADH-quinone reductase subunit C [Vibrio chagasii]PML54509.1 Na(+)-translocating NADH-quinone reductase subunit C [Vibrio sp. 10N.261.5|eukprot:TRINITY_DN1158_c0_g1_i2.p6 TRINITY_DN1158_c0_g1~~TRINITY_DN1158_c0_g1_i2.p6  ORF type:complete len:256 (+),score=39.61 TRINITY_DN1158_c0_g1_i2:4521-5288(+)